MYFVADDVNDDPGFFTGLFTMQDPVQNRRIMGIGRVNLAARTIDFSPIGPAEGVSFAMAPDRKRGYGLLQQLGRYEFWAFALEAKKLLNRTLAEQLIDYSTGELVAEAGHVIDDALFARIKELRDNPEI